MSTRKKVLIVVGVIALLFVLVYGGRVLQFLGVGDEAGNTDTDTGDASSLALSQFG